MARHRMSNRVKINWAETYACAQSILDDLGISVSPNEQVKNLGMAQQQMVEIAKALSNNSGIIVMDEPTSSLTSLEIEHLFRAIRNLKKSGVSIIYISHRLEEVKEIGDRVTIMRDGKTIANLDIKDASIDEIIKLMVGRELKEKFPKGKVTFGNEVFRVEHLSSGKSVQDISLSVRAGEILGIGGLVVQEDRNCTRYFGLDKNATARFVKGEECHIKSPRDAIASGIGFVTEDRKNEGLVLTMDVGSNITLASLRKFGTSIHLNLRNERKVINDFIAKLNIRTPNSYQKVRNLSGGNQQKAVIAKWILQNSSVLILDEPTRA
jgi:ribose transport system ATP-binding protein